MPPVPCTPLPARAIQGRLLAAAEQPSWASYLPMGLELPAKAEEGSGADVATASAVVAPTTWEGPMADAVPGQVWSLARDPSGCRAVQSAFEEAESEEAREALVEELRGHVWDALRCPHANFVVQKAVVTTRPQASQFIIEELMAKGAAQAARHKYGCRIVQRLLEKCEPGQTEGLVEALLAEGVALSKHVYANFVMQLVLDRGTWAQRQRLAWLLQCHAGEVGADAYASAVVAKALTNGQQEDQRALARALVQAPGLIAAMARSRYGYLAVKSILQLQGPERDAARKQLMAHKDALRASRYGRLVVSSLGPRGYAPPPPCAPAGGELARLRPALGGA